MPRGVRRRAAQRCGQRGPHSSAGPGGVAAVPGQPAPRWRPVAGQEVRASLWGPRPQGRPLLRGPGPHPRTWDRRGVRTGQQQGGSAPRELGRTLPWQPPPSPLRRRSPVGSTRSDEVEQDRDQSSALLGRGGRPHDQHLADPAHAPPSHAPVTDATSPDGIPPARRRPGSASQVPGETNDARVTRVRRPLPQCPRSGDHRCPRTPHPPTALRRTRLRPPPSPGPQGRIRRPHPRPRPR